MLTAYTGAKPKGDKDGCAVGDDDDFHAGLASKRLNAALQGGGDAC